MSSTLSKHRHPAGMPPKAKPRWWSVTMLVILIGYLMFEFVFNVKLVELVGGRVANTGDIHAVELFGRAISGIGVSLMLADLLVRGQWLKTKLRALLAGLLILTVVWPTVFFGQKWLIERLLIESSTPAERQQAVFGQLLRTSLASNSVAIEGIPFRPDHEATPAEMTFLALFGGMAYADNALIGHLESQRERIAETYIRQKAYGEFDKHYAQYRAVGDALRDRYQDYAKASASYQQELEGTERRIDTAWEKVEKEIRSGWMRYQQGQKQHEDGIQKRAEKFAPQIYQYFQYREDCRSATCRARLDELYEKQMSKTDIGYVEPGHWLIVEEVSATQNWLRLGAETLVTGGVALLARGADALSGGDGGWENKRFKFTNSVGHYRERIRPLVEEKFVQSSGGYPSNLKNLAAFRNHPATSKTTREELRKDGIRLSENWTVADIGAFRSAARTKIRAEIDARWKKELSKRQLDVRPGLSWSQFQQEADIQKRLRHEMGDFYVQGMRVDHNNIQFKQTIMEPNIHNSARRLLDDIQASQAEFADGRRHAERGKDALRAILIPPISMTLSLFLTLLTLTKIPRKVWSLIEPLLATTVRLPQRWIWPAVQGCLLAVILAGPLLVGRNDFVGQESAVHYFLERISEGGSPATALALKWVMYTQPLVMNTGWALDDKLGLYSGYLEMVATSLDAFDARIESMHR